MKKTDEKQPATKTKKDKKPGKVPSVLTKKYTDKQLEKKFYKKIYIPADKKFLQSFIVKLEEPNKKGQALYSIPKGTKIPKNDCKRLKTICKEIKAQKGGLKWQPLVAVIAFIAILCTAVTLTKDILLKKAIVSACESIFEAKTDVKTVNLRFRDSSFRVKGLEIGNKKEPMKNLVSIDSIVMDFEFSQLLRARIIADELSVTGVETNTDRKTSCELSKKKLSKIEKSKEKDAAKAAKQTEDSAFMKSLNERQTAAKDVLKNSVTGLFDKYNPESIMQNCYSQMQTPSVSKNVEAKSKELSTKYQNTPKELEAEVAKVKASVDAASKINIDSIKNDPVKLKEAITTLTNAYNDVQALKNKTDAAVSGMKTDLNTATSLTKELNNAIAHDQNLVNTQLKEITSLNLGDAKNFISTTFDNVGYSVLGKYYPYAKTAVDYLIGLKNNNKAKDKKTKTEKKKSTVTKRSEGRVVYFPTETAPKFWIKKVSGSGKNFTLNALNITTDMDKTGKPATGTLTLNLKNIKHNGNFVVDTRSTSEAALVHVDYECSQLPVSLPADKIGNIPGVPGIDSSTAALSAIIEVFDNEGFTLSGAGKFANLVLSAPAFSPEYASKIFMNTLSSINALTMKVTGGYKATDGLILNVKTDADKQFLNGLTSALTKEMSGIVESSKKEINAKISDLSGGALSNLDSFKSSSSAISSYADYANSSSNKINSKKKEAEKALTNSAKSAASSAATNAASGMLNNLKK